MINLLLAIHNHQPVGNFGYIFEKAFKQCYWPILNTLAEFPKVRISMHHSGPLLDYAKKYEPAYIPTLVKMIKAGQIEPLGGGYYEPILAVIPTRDASGQIQMLQDFWAAESGFRPNGIWTTERIWEPSLTTLLAENGIKFTILDDEHFRAAGITDNPVKNYYITERHGEMVSILPSDATLRYYIPFKSPEDVIAHLVYLADTYPGSAITYGDDGEKFGMWPGTFEWVIEKGWLKKFFQLLTERSDKINVTTISEYLAKNKPEGRVYLPTCSYHEMGEWAMPAHSIHKLDEIKQFLEQHGKWEEAKPFVRGGYWDNFLTKYPESNYMHKKMLHVSGKIAKSEVGGQRSEKISEAKKHLYMAQCNCAYWHGLFGGLYLNYLRHAIYDNLIKAENIIDAAAGNASATRIEKTDIDCDLNEEIIISNKELIAVVKPERGGSLIEFSNRKSGLNLQDVLSRHEEAYHKTPKVQEKVASEQKDGIPSIHDLNKDPSKIGKIVYDPCERYSFLDRIWKADAEPEQALKRFCKTPYAVASVGTNNLKLVATYNDLTIEKEFFMEDGASFKAHYRLKWSAPVKEAVRFGTELNLTLLAGHDEKRYYLDTNGQRSLLDSVASLKDVEQISLVDEYFNFRLEITANKKMDVWRYPVQTISQSEAGFDLLYQGSCIIWSIIIPVGTAEMEFDLDLNFKH